MAFLFKKEVLTYDKNNKKPVLKCSICNGEQVAGFKDLSTGKFEDIMLIKNDNDLKRFMKIYNIDYIDKIYWGFEFFSVNSILLW